MYVRMTSKKCSLCNKSSESDGIALIYFGEWLKKKELTVHYYCLLLSTHLPQRGEDHSGILGFLLRDIRHEVAMAKKRKCKYCFEKSATIQCNKCKEYFHLTCGHTSKCLSQFVGEFKSYCHACTSMDQFQIDLFARKPQQTNELCYICAQVMGPSPERWIYAKCCSNGFTHSKCMKIYALSAGYYLTCIWCKDKSFREDVKYQGVFVPDREANWEREEGAFMDLYRGHRRCDMEVCKCPKGRDYTNSYKWQLITCKFCGAFGAHNPACIPGFEDCKEKVDEFKCDVCSVTEQTVFHKTLAGSVHELIDTSLFINKDSTNATKPLQITQSYSQPLNTNEFPFNSVTSQETINVKLKHISNSGAIAHSQPADEAGTLQIASAIYTLTQSPEPKLTEPKVSSEKQIRQRACSSGNNAIADLLVDKLLSFFEVNY